MKNSFFKTKNKVFKKEISEEFIDEMVPEKGKFFSEDFHHNTDFIKQLYSYPENVDFVHREFTIPSLGKKAAVFYIRSLSDVKLIYEEIIKPLITANNSFQDVPSSIGVSAISEEKEITKSVRGLNTGATLLFVEGETQVYIIETEQIAGRSVEKPQNETTLFGPKEGFIEKAHINISLIRKKIRSEDFMVEKMTIGARSNNEVFIVYNKELVGEKVLSEVKERIGAVKKDAVQNLGLLAQHIEDRKRSLAPTVLQTERPDRAASFIEDGYVAVVMNNSPFALVAPATFWSFFHAADDIIYGLSLVTLRDSCEYWRCLLPYSPLPPT